MTSTHASVLANEAAPLEPLLTLLHSAPLPTTFGSLGALIMPLRLAMTQLALPRFDTERFASLIDERRPTWLLMVPAQILLLLESGALAGRDTGSVRMVMFGSAGQHRRTRCRPWPRRSTPGARQRLRPDRRRREHLHDAAG